ncbi:MAG TPA: universal stress protein [Methylomirabilota bacterium]|nr:universal stress protein [Methylomirabilota bacterium]
MTMRVLLATDGSEDAQAATGWLAGCALPEDTAVRVLTVLTLPPAALDIPTVRDFQASLHRQGRALADGTCASLVGRVRTVEACVEEGDPREAIVRAAEEWPANLIVLGARGLSGMEHLLLGSVSLGVARHAPCPVLVVKGGARDHRRVLIAIDGSEPALAAARFVSRLPLGPEACVQLVGVAERPRFPSTAPAAATITLRAAIEDIVAERKTALGRALEAAAALFAPGGPRVERTVSVGHPADEIVRAAEDGGAGLVVVGARGLGAIKRMLLGSVSEVVLRNVRAAVLIVRD